MLYYYNAESAHCNDARVCCRPHSKVGDNVGHRFWKACIPTKTVRDHNIIIMSRKKNHLTGHIKHILLSYNLFLDFSPITL